nr:protein ALP1-like isoform X2 [Onthophagus taurus]
MDFEEEFYLAESTFPKLLLFGPRKRQFWVNEIYLNHHLSEYFKIFEELKNQPLKFYEYYRMTYDTYFYILNAIEEDIRKQCNFRECISPSEKLTVTLRFLSTGLGFRSLAYSFRMSHSTIRKVIYETCTAIWNKLNLQHLPQPTKESLLRSSTSFFDKWNFPNCIGCIDGKHIRIKCPSKTGTMFYNYKQYFSIVLQAVADANYKFVCIDVGGYGKQSDGGTFASSTLSQQLEHGSLLPENRKLPNSDVVLPHVLLGDDAYPLKKYLMKPYSKRNLSREEEIFNYRLSRCRRTVECSFGIMTAKWRLLNKPIECHPDKTGKVLTNSIDCKLS